MLMTRMILALCGGFAGGHAISLAVGEADPWKIVMNFGICGICLVLLTTASDQEENDETLNE